MYSAENCFHNKLLFVTQIAERILAQRSESAKSSAMKQNHIAIAASTFGEAMKDILNPGKIKVDLPSAWLRGEALTPVLIEAATTNKA